MGLLALPIVVFAAPAVGARQTCPDPGVPTSLGTRAVTVGQVGPEESDFYRFPESAQTTFAVTIVNVAGSVQVYAYEDCSIWSCRVWNDLAAGGAGSSACMGPNFHPRIFEVRHQASSSPAPVVYVVHVDDCPTASLNAACHEMPKAPPLPPIPAVP